MHDRNQENPYRSPGPEEMASSPNQPPGRWRTADLAIVGLVWGTLIEAAVGAGSVALLPVSTAAWQSFVAGESPADVTGFEELIASTAAFASFGSLLGGLSGLVIGAALGALAGRVTHRSRKTLFLLSIAASVSIAVAWSALLGRVALNADLIGKMTPATLTMAVAILAAGFGGRTLAERIARAAWGTGD